MNTELEPEVIDAIQNGSKLAAIKKLRELRGIGLKESKALIDAYCAKNNIPSPSVQAANSRGGWILLIAICGLGYFLFRYIG